MSRINKAFENGKAFIAFITGGDPDIETTEKLIYTLEEAGTNLIEIGIPFSDPVAEGIVIEKANERALKKGCTVDDIFAMVERVRKKSEIPLVFLTYLNPIYTYGKERFLKRASEVGVDGIIVPDLPYEEKEEIAPECKKYGIDLVPLIAPTSKERIGMIAKEAEGFVYCVSSLGVTGVRQDIETDLAAMIEEVRKVTDIPCAVGFGISTPEQGAEISQVADGIIVGSAIVRLIEEHGRDSSEAVYEYVKEMCCKI